MPCNHRSPAFALLALVLLSCAACEANDPPPRNFDGCLARNNPAMLSYPRRCHDPESGKTFTESVPETPSAHTGSYD